MEDQRLKSQFGDGLDIMDKLGNCQRTLTGL